MSPPTIAMASQTASAFLKIVAVARAPPTGRGGTGRGPGVTDGRSESRIMPLSVGYSCNMMLPLGYSDLPDGKLASVVTCLEMLAKPALRVERADPSWELRRIVQPDPVWYRELFRRVGSEWLWYSRLVMPLHDLEAILRNPGI